MAEAKSATVRVAPKPKETVSLDQHEKNMAAIREKQDAKQPELRKMLDPDYASEIETRKPRGQYRVTCAINDRHGGKMVSEEKTGVVTAQNEDQAWKKLCDQMRHWPSPRHCDRKIEKV